MKRKKQKRKKSCVFAVILTVVFILAMVFTLTVANNRTNKAIASLDGQEITAEELEFYQRMEESAVRNYYRANYGITLEREEMWSQKVDGIEPRQLLAERALERCMKDKTLFLLASKQGIEVPLDYTQLKQAVENENKERKKALENDEVVYGVNQFAEEEYLSRIRTNTRNQLIEELSREEEQTLYVSEEEIRTYYEANKEDWSAKATTTHVVDIMLTNPLTEEEAGQIAELIRSGEDLEDIEAAYPKGLEVKKRVFTSDSYTIDLRSCYEIRLAADEMEEGDVRIIAVEEVINVVYIEERISDEEETLGTYSNQIRSVVAEQKFENFLNSYQEKMPFELAEEKFIWFYQR